MLSEGIQTERFFFYVFEEVCVVSFLSSLFFFLTRDLTEDLWIQVNVPQKSDASPSPCSEEAKFGNTSPLFLDPAAELTIQVVELSQAYSFV